MNARRNGKKRRIKIGIRPQLIFLVGFASLFSLLILAIVAGVYFSTNLSNLRSERLEVVSQMKATQIEQSIQYIYYQVYWLSTKDTVTSPLSLHRAGNNSDAVFNQAQGAIDQFLSSSEMFASARLYDLDLNPVVDSTNNATNLSVASESVLYPLAKGSAVPRPILDGIPSVSGAAIQGFVTGPLPNSSDTRNTTYYMGITLPVYSNSSIILKKATVAGYFTVIASASIIQNSLQYSTNKHDNEYTVSLIQRLYLNSSSVGDPSALIGFDLVFPSSLDSSVSPNVFHPISESPDLRKALTSKKGISKSAKSLEGKEVAMGYTALNVDSQTFWTILVQQNRSSFMSPVRRLTKIMVGVVIGIGVFMCLITFPLAVWFVIPITKLKEATEAITRSKKERDGFPYRNFRHDHDSSGNLHLHNNHNHHHHHHHHHNNNSRENHSQNNHTNNNDNEVNEPKIENESVVTKRNSVNSAASSLTAYSTGIRLPDKIPQSKKLFKDELTELQDAFNIMTEELEKQYTHLEDRVRSRTRELEASKIEAEAANEAKTVFIANISHELRTPLNGILGMTSIAMEDKDPQLIHDSLKLIHRSGELLLHILTELLTYSKNTLNRSKLEKSNFQVLEILYQVKSIFGKLASDQRVNLRISLRPNILRKLILYGDSNRIIQVVMNLVSNSLKFTPIMGSVEVNFKLLGEYDQERSKAVNYEKVYVKRDEFLLTPNDETGATGNEEDPLAATQEAKEAKEANEANDQAPATPQQRRKQSVVSNHSAKPNELDPSDNQSLVTISTTEYENTIFKAQFNNNNKALPRLPGSSAEASRTSMSSNGMDSSGAREVSDEKAGAADGESKFSNESIVEKEVDNSNSGNESGNAQSNLVKTTTAPQNDSVSAQKSDWTSFVDAEASMGNGGMLSTSELVKNNKVYKMRKLYVPRSWVVQIEVKDTGSGIEPALQEKVFEPFIQGDQSLSRSYGGTGLGLSICRQLAKMMHGTLTLKSTIGKGSTFTFTVPLPQQGEILVPDEEMEEFSNDVFNQNSKVNRKVAFDVVESGDTDESNSNTNTNTNSDGPATPEQNVVSDESGGKDGVLQNGQSPRSSKSSPKKKSMHLELPKPMGNAGNFTSTGTANTGPQGQSILADVSNLRILVAEDNSVNQEVIKRMLRLEGFTNVTMAGNGLEAVEFVKRSYETMELFNIIFMDVQMPKMDGLTSTHLIRNNLRYKRPIIALTAFADESNVKECLACGMSGFLSKPIKRMNLRQIMTEFSSELLGDIVTTPASFNEEKKLP